MATTKKEETITKVSPVLKKRTSPDELVSNETSSTRVNPLKKRILPGDEPSPVVKEKKGMPLKKKTINPLDSNNGESENKEKSSLEQMKERIAAQKKLEQDMMTQQSIRSQEKGVLRNKLSALAKDMAEEDDLEIKEKPDFSSDLKTEVLETQNKKLKSDLDKIKKQLQSLQALEYNSVRVIEFENLTLSDEFINSIKVNQQNNDLENDLKIKTEQLQSLQTENQKLVVNYKLQLRELQDSLNNQIKDLNKELKTKTKELEKVIAVKDTLTVDKQNLQTENKNLSDQVNSLLAKLSDSDQENKNKELLNSEIDSLKENLKNLEQLQSELIEKNNKIAELESQLANTKSKEKTTEEALKEKETELEKLTNDYNQKLDSNNKEIELLKKQISNDKSEEFKQQVKDLQSSKDDIESKYSKLLKENEKIKEQSSQKENEFKLLEDKYNKLLTEYNNKVQELETATLNAKNREKDYAKISELETDIIKLKGKIKENDGVVSELTDLYNRFMDAEKVLIEKSRDARKYIEIAKEFRAIKDLYQKAQQDLAAINPKENRKAYKVKSAEIKNLNYKATYLEKQMKKLQRKKNVAEHLKLSAKLNELNEQFKMYNSRNQELNTIISNKEKELSVLKG